MNRQPYERPPCWWGPKPSRFWVWFWRQSRRRMQINKHRLVDIEVRNLQHLEKPLAEGCGVLITPNHSSHADCYSIYDLADRLGIPFYGMIAWQNFARDGRLRAHVLRQHGGFSVDREGNDLAAFRQAVEVLRQKASPLVIFPEGDVYHVNDRILPFRDGPAAIALSAARKAERKIVAVPCAIKYCYVEDPTSELVEVMGRLEESIHWRRRNDLSLAHRIYHLAEGALSLKEIEFCGRSSSGPLPQRIANLMDLVLSRLDQSYELETSGNHVAERVKLLRQQVIRRTTETSPDSPERQQCHEDLADLFFTIQLLSYPGDYVAEDPSIERIAETIDKLEEDILGVKTATIRGSRRAEITLGEPVPVHAGRRDKMSATDLTRQLEARVQQLLGGGVPAWHAETQQLQPAEQLEQTG